MEIGKGLPKLVIITGAPASGKTCLLEMIRKKFSIPCFSKDQFKEMYYDNIGFPENSEEHGKFGKSAHDSQAQIMSELLKNKISLVLEGNFCSKLFGDFIVSESEKYSFELLQIILECDSEAVFKRFKERGERGKLHPGHQPLKFIDIMEEKIKSYSFQPIDFPGKVVKVDTTVFSSDMYVDVLSALEEVVN